MQNNLRPLIILAVIGLAMGAVFSLMQNKGTDTPPVAVVSETKEVVAEAPVVAEENSAEPVIEGAPPMPAMPPAVETKADDPEVEGVKIGGAFSLTDHKGNAVTEKSWPGKYKLVFFGFTHCPAICPAAMEKIGLVMEKADPEGTKIVPLFVTVDPERDTPEVMAAYIANLNKNIVALSGTRAQIDQAVDAYKVFAARVQTAAEYNAELASESGAANPDADYMMDHSAYIYLMSPTDEMIAFFRMEDSAEAVLEKVQAALSADKNNP